MSVSLYEHYERPVRYDCFFRVHYEPLSEEFKMPRLFRLAVTSTMYEQSYNFALDVAAVVSTGTQASRFCVEGMNAKAFSHSNENITIISTRSDTLRHTLSKCSHKWPMFRLIDLFLCDPSRPVSPDNNNSNHVLHLKQTCQPPQCHLRPECQSFKGVSTALRPLSKTTTTQTATTRRTGLPRAGAASRSSGTVRMW